MKEDYHTPRPGARGFFSAVNNRAPLTHRLSRTSIPSATPALAATMVFSP